MSHVAGVGLITLAWERALTRNFSWSALSELSYQFFNKQRHLRRSNLRQMWRSPAPDKATAFQIVRSLSMGGIERPTAIQVQQCFISNSNKMAGSLSDQLMLSGIQGNVVRSSTMPELFADLLQAWYSIANCWESKTLKHEPNPNEQKYT